MTRYNEMRSALDGLLTEVAGAGRLHRTVASSAFPNGAWLYCDHPGCDRGEKISSEDAARYLAHGWPMHHGRTMSIATERRP